jgi:hypothetical protein
MRQLLHILLLMLVLTFGSQNECHALNSDVQHTEQQRKDTLHGISISDQQQPSATLTDASNIYRICNARPQRILPVYGTNSHQTASRMQSHYLLFVSNLYSFTGKYSLREASFFTKASSRYYVYTLRHIIC